MTNLNNSLNRNRDFSRLALARLNVERFKSILSYFSDLNTAGKISDQSYHNLVRYACAIFIKTEIEEIVEKTLEQKLEQFLLSRMLKLNSLLSDSEASTLQSRYISTLEE